MTISTPASAQAVCTTWRPLHPVDVADTLAPLRRGASDPTYVAEPGGALWRVSRYPSGAATLRLSQAAGVVQAQAWGPGAAEAIGALPDTLGGRDDASGFVAGHPLVAQLHRRHPGLRVPRTGLVLEALVPAILEQKVTNAEARRSWRELLARYGEPAPGPAPAGMRVPPPAAVWKQVPSWEWHRAGVDGKRSRAVLAAAGVASRLEQTVGLPTTQARRRLSAVPGIGAWTAAEVMQRAHGDADAVSVGDFHLPTLVGMALLGRPLDDEGMLAVLEPWRPHRYRVVRLLVLSASRRPRFAPRAPARDYRAM